jgi:hypothetical protein
MVKTNRPLPHRTVEFCNTIGSKADIGRNCRPLGWTLMTDSVEKVSEKELWN